MPSCCGSSWASVTRRWPRRWAGLRPMPPGCWSSVPSFTCRIECFSMSDDDALLRIAKSVADRTPIDWNREGSSHPGLRPHLERLRALEAIVTLHSAAPADALIGRTLSHYRVLEKIGAGGMGVVYLAHDERLDRDVALKALPTGLLSDKAARRRFRKEALALSRLNHPGIATIFDFDTQEGADFLVMEHIQGV